MGIDFIFNCENGRDITFSDLTLWNMMAVFIGVGTYGMMRVEDPPHEDAPGVIQAHCS